MVWDLSSPYTGTPLKLTGNVNQPGAIAIAADGSVVVANNGGANNTISILYPFGSAATNQTGDISNAQQLLFDSAGNLFVVNASGGPGGQGYVAEFAPSYIGGATVKVTLPNSASPGSVAVDDASNLYVNDALGNLYIYAPPYTGTPTTLAASDGSNALHVYVK